MPVIEGAELDETQTPDVKFKDLQKTAMTQWAAIEIKSDEAKSPAPIVPKLSKPTKARK